MLKKKIRNQIINLRKKKFSNVLKINSKKLIKIIKQAKISNPIIGGYYPIRCEIDCIEILKELEKQKLKISLPKIKKNNQMEFFRWSTGDPMTLNKLGIPEPQNLNIIYPDVLIVPIVAFDSLKFRIGYGGGYYDRYLEKIRKKKKILVIGFAFSFQQIKQVPINKFDKRLDLIMTEKTIIK